MLLSNRQIIGTRLISPFQSFHYQKEFTKPHRWRSRQQFFSVGVGEKSKKDSNIHNSTEKILCLPNIANENIRFQITKIHVKAGKAIKASQRDMMDSYFFPILIISFWNFEECKVESILN